LLAEAIAKSANLFNQGGRLVWLHEGELRPREDVLGELIRRHVVTKHPVHRGAKGWGVEYRPFEPDEKTIRALLTEMPSVRSLRLIDRVAKA
jgi:hypothetical protein